MVSLASAAAGQSRWCKKKLTRPMSSAHEWVDLFLKEALKE
jgi:hypothetical protein